MNANRIPEPLRRQAVLRPLVGALLLSAVAAALLGAAVKAAPAGFAVAATATTAEAAAIALARRAARECGFARADKGWHPQHRLQGVRCSATAEGRQRCEALATCTDDSEGQLALR